MAEYIITDKQMGLIQDFANVCVEGEKLPKIVRCRDCGDFDRWEYADGNMRNVCARFEFADVTPDGFCAWAERKEQ